MQLLKVHGSGNDFYILDEDNLDIPLTEEQLIKLTKQVCHRKTGLFGGADGILYICASQHQRAVAKMRVLNADGSEASMCGNGLRSVGRYLSEKYGLDHLVVETMYADLEVQKATDFAQNVLAFGVEISPVSFAATDLKMQLGKTKLLNEVVPAFGSLKFSAVAVPNPHLIAFGEHNVVHGDQLGQLASWLNDGKNSYFSDGVNVSFVEILDSNKIFVRTYERGVGYTNACGTAMSAASLIYTLLNDLDFEKEITVLNPGGMVKTIVHQTEFNEYKISLIGNATVLGMVEIDLKQALNGEFNEFNYQATDEQAAYENFVADLK